MGFCVLLPVYVPPPAGNPATEQGHSITEEITEVPWTRRGASNQLKS